MTDARLDFDSTSRRISKPPPAPPSRSSAAPDVGAFPDAVRASHVPARHRLFDRADPSDHVYEVSEGAAMITRVLPDNAHKIIDIVGARRLFGFSRGALHECTAVTLAPCVVYAYRLDGATWESALAKRLAHAMADEIQRMRDHVVLLGRKSAAARVAGFLCAWLTDPKAARSKAVVPLLRAEVADYLGLTNETVSRTIGKLKRERVLGPEDGDTIVASDVRRLKALARGEAIDA